MTQPRSDKQRIAFAMRLGGPGKARLRVLEDPNGLLELTESFTVGWDVESSATKTTMSDIIEFSCSTHLAFSSSPTIYESLISGSTKTPPNPPEEFASAPETVQRLDGTAFCWATTTSIGWLCPEMTKRSCAASRKDFSK